MYSLGIYAHVLKEWRNLCQQRMMVMLIQPGGKKREFGKKNPESFGCSGNVWNGSREKSRVQASVVVQWLSHIRLQRHGLQHARFPRPSPLPEPAQTQASEPWHSFHVE